MEIISKSRELSKMEQYKLTRGNSTNAKDAVGTTIHPDAWCIYQEVNARGEDVEILAILDHDGSVYSTMSQTFKREFDAIVDIMAGDDFKVTIIDGLTNSGRSFVTCTLAE